MNNSLPVDIGAQLAPDYLFQMNNLDITENLRPRLLSMTIDDARGLEADALTLLLDDSDGRIMMPQRGTILRVYIGWKGRPLFCKGDFVIEELHHSGAPDQLKVVGRSANLSNSLMEKGSHSYDKTTLGAMVLQIAKRNELGAEVADQLASIEIEHEDQTGVTDAQFLTTMATKYGATVTIKEDKVLMLVRGANKTVSGQEIPQLLLTRKDGDKHDYQVVSQMHFSGVKASWIRLDKASRGTVRVFRVIPENQPDRFPGTARQDIPLPLYERYALIPGQFKTQEEATEAAKADWKKRQAMTASMTFVIAQGMPVLIPETPIRLSGFKTMIDAQQWTVIKVNHVIDNNGFRTTVNLEKSVGGETWGTDFKLGEVTGSEKTT